KIQNLNAFGTTFLPVFDSVEAKRRRKLFHRDRILETNAVRMCNKRARACRDSKSRHLSDPNGRLSDDSRVQSTSRSLDDPLELISFLRAAHMSSLFPQLVDHRILNPLIADNRLLRRTQSSIVEAFSRQNVADGFGDIRCLLNVGRNVPRSDAERRFACAVRRAHQTCAAS